MTRPIYDWTTFDDWGSFDMEEDYSKCYNPRVLLQSCNRIPQQCQGYWNRNDNRKEEKQELINKYCKTDKASKLDIAACKCANSVPPPGTEVKQEDAWMFNKDCRKSYQASCNGSRLTKDKCDLYNKVVANDPNLRNRFVEQKCNNTENYTNKPTSEEKSDTSSSSTKLFLVLFIILIVIIGMIFTIYSSNKVRTPSSSIQ
jgi:hypothetical protein